MKTDARSKKALKGISSSQTGNLFLRLNRCLSAPIFPTLLWVGGITGIRMGLLFSMEHGGNDLQENFLSILGIGAIAASFSIPASLVCMMVYYVILFSLLRFILQMNPLDRVSAFVVLSILPLCLPYFRDPESHLKLLSFLLPSVLTGAFAFSYYLNKRLEMILLHDSVTRQLIRKK